MMARVVPFLTLLAATAAHTTEPRSVKIGNFLVGAPCGIAFIVNDSAAFVLDTGGDYDAGTTAPDNSFQHYTFQRDGATVEFDWGSVGESVVGRLTTDKPVVLPLKLSSSWPGWTSTFRGTRDGALGTASAKGKLCTWQLQTDPKPLRTSNEAVVVALAPGAPVRFVAGLGTLPTLGKVEGLLNKAQAAYSARRPAASGDWGDFVGAIADNMNNSRTYSNTNHVLAHAVSRGWSNGPNGAPYFCWDSFFTANLACLDDPAGARQTVRTILSYQDDKGLVPNFAHVGKNGDQVSSDRSQPPVGALCVWKLHQRWPDTAFLAEVYPKLVKWHRWWPTARDANHNGLLEWGSATGVWQNAQYETGWDDNLHFAGTRMVGTAMDADAVDLNALYSMDAQYLAALADALGKKADALAFRAEHAAINKRINALLWNETLGMYCSRRFKPEKSMPADSGFQDGFEAVFFGDETLTQEIARRHEKTPTASQPGTHWSARWTGTFTPPVTGFYRFRTIADDGVRVFVGGKRIINDWRTHPATEREAEVELAVGTPTPVVVEYFQGEGGAELSLSVTSLQPGGPENAFLTRVTLMNLFPLSCGAAQGERAQRMVSVLTDPKKFWGTWVIPTLPYDDPNYKQQQYWRGNIWGPASYLAWQGIQRYTTPAQQAEFAQKSVALFRKNWTTQKLCGENYDSITGKQSSDDHYTWGALLNLIGIESIVDVGLDGKIHLNGAQTQTLHLSRVPIQGQLYDIQTRPGLAELLLNGKVVQRAGSQTNPPSLGVALSGAGGNSSAAGERSIYLLTTPEGANLPAGTSVENFPVLVRLSKETFPFDQVKPGGEDLRFTDSQGRSLAFQIEQWDAVAGRAAIWVRVPQILGNTRQELKVLWGDPMTKSESDGAAVFNASNGYRRVWHLDGALRDAVSNQPLTNAGTSAALGQIGAARHFAAGQGLFGGDQLTDLPTGSQPQSTEAWLRAEKPNSTVIGWGNEERQGKVVMQFRSPPHINLDCYFSDANVTGKSRLPLGEWVHVVHTYEKGDARVYVNGVLDSVAKSQAATLNVKSPARLWLGGWYNNYDFVGELDEVRLSTVARAPEWIKLQYENQKPQQTLVGMPVQPGTTFAISPAQVTLREGSRTTINAKAGGALKLLWLLDGHVVATDQLSYTLEAGRVRGNQTRSLQLKALYPDGVKTATVPVVIQEAIPDPAFTLQAPRQWDGRTPIQVLASQDPTLRYAWSVSGLAVAKEVLPGKLRLTRAQNSGTLTVRVAVDNGGQPVTKTITIQVKEPAKDPWVEHKPSANEQPVDNQFYARNDKNEGRLTYNGTLDTAADTVFLRVYADNQLYFSRTQKLPASRAYAFSVALKPGLIHYRTEFGASTNGKEVLLRTTTNLVCGDAYVIQGQSNAVATDFGKDEPTFQSEWIRTFGAQWDVARHRNRAGETLEIGYWGMELARRLLESHQIPICILNGAVGGTRIDQHQRNPMNPTDSATIYGRLLARVRKAGLTEGIRGILWHQGENDQGADGPTGGFGWETYQQYFIDLAAAWKTDYPNVQHYYVFQIWPKSCSMGIDGSDNRLREVQRNLPTLFSHMSIMSTLGIEPPGGCHFPAAGYAEFARLIFPLVEKGNYGKSTNAPLTPANLQRATWRSTNPDELVLEFDQPMAWDKALVSEFYVDGQKETIASGSAVGNRVHLKLKTPERPHSITYLDSAAWKQTRLLRGTNGIAALTFCEVPVR